MGTGVFRHPPRLIPKPKWVGTAVPAAAPSLLAEDKGSGSRARASFRPHWRHPPPLQRWGVSITTPSLLYPAQSAGEAEVVRFRPHWRQPPLPQPWIGTTPPPAAQSLIWTGLSPTRRMQLLYRPYWRQPPHLQPFIWSLGVDAAYLIVAEQGWWMFLTNEPLLTHEKIEGDTLDPEFGVNPRGKQWPDNRPKITHYKVQ